MISELRTLLAVARHGTFAAAGARIGLTQAAISGQIKRLEARLGFTLFERTGRSATLNAAGLRTIERAEDIIARFEALTDPVDSIAGGQIRIGAIASVQSTVLARALVPFRLRYPKHHVRILPGVSLNLLDMIDGGELDLALVIRPSFGIPKTFTWRALIREPFMLAVPKAAADDDWRLLLQKRPFIRYERGSIGGRQVERFLRTKAFVVKESIEVDDIPAMLALVAAGLGVALLPSTEACYPLSGSVSTISLGQETFCREIGLLTSRQCPPAVAYLTSCLTSSVSSISAS